MSQILNPSGGGGGSTSILKITGNDGLQETPDAGGNFNLVTANSTIKFLGTTNTETLDFANTTTFNVALGSTLASRTTGIANTGLGYLAINSITSGSNNIGIGIQAGFSITTGNSNFFLGNSTGLTLTTGSTNVIVGSGGLTLATTSSSNVGVGSGVLSGITTSTGNNTAVGDQSFNRITTGANNIGVGKLSGNACTSSESNNIYIGNLGVLAESNTLRIGTQGTQTSSYIVGPINSASDGAIATPAFTFSSDPTTGMWVGGGKLHFSAGGNDALNVDTGINNLSILAANTYIQKITMQGSLLSLTTIPGAYPYTVSGSFDYIVLVDTSSARTINLPAVPGTGYTCYVKDNVGSAGANNITVSGNGHNIEGIASATISTNWASWGFVYNGTEWVVLSKA